LTENNQNFNQIEAKAQEPKDTIFSQQALFLKEKVQFLISKCIMMKISKLKTIELAD